MNVMATSTLSPVVGTSQLDHKTRFVSPAQFCELLISRRNLVRSDDRNAKIRGLIDPSDGIRFLVKEEELAKLAQSPRDGGSST